MNNIDTIITKVIFDIGGLLPGAVVIFLATYAIWFTALMFLYAAISVRPRSSWRHLAAETVLAVSISLAINLALGILFFRERPFVSFEFDPIVKPFLFQKSFPSLHAVIAWSAAWTCFLYSRRLGLILIGMAALVSFGRVLAGVHYFSDVAAGAVIGIAVSFLTHWLYKRFIKK